MSDVGLLRDKTYQEYLINVKKIGTENKSHVNAARLIAMGTRGKLATPENRNIVFEELGIREKRVLGCCIPLIYT